MEELFDLQRRYAIVIVFFLLLPFVEAFIGTP